MNEHHPYLGYTTNDDGVWIFCSCGWNHNLGFGTSMEDAVVAAAQHVDPHANQHVIRLADNGWIIRHPVSERLSGSLLDCPWGWVDDDLGLRGTFVLVWDEGIDECVLGEQIDA